MRAWLKNWYLHSGACVRCVCVCVCVCVCMSWRGAARPCGKAGPAARGSHAHAAAHLSAHRPSAKAATSSGTARAPSRPARAWPAGLWSGARQLGLKAT